MTAATTAIELRLTAFAAATPDTELAGLLRWACLHIREQSEALTEAQTEAEDEMNARIRIETATHSAAMKLKEAFDALAQATPAYIDIARDTSHHVNLMAVAHGDPDYGTEQKPQKHVDVRGVAPRKVKRPRVATFTEADERRIRAAANASGQQFFGWVEATNEPLVAGAHSPTAWNPRDNDGDSRRLANDMDMTVTVRPHEVEVFHDELDYPVSMAFGDGEDRNAVVRLAVLEAAARVGGAV